MARPPARWLNQPSAICERPALCTQRNSTVGPSSASLASGSVRCRGGRRRRSAGDGRGRGSGPRRDGQRAPPTSWADDERRDADAGVMPAKVLREGPADRDRGVGEAGRGREPVGRGDVAADGERRRRRRARSARRRGSRAAARRWRRPRRARGRPTSGRGSRASTAARSNMRLATIAPTHAADDLGDDVDAGVARARCRRARGRRA